MLTRISAPRTKYRQTQRRARQGAPPLLCVNERREKDVFRGSVLELRRDVGRVVLALLDRQRCQRAEHIGDRDRGDGHRDHVHIDQLAHEDGGDERAQTADVEREADAGAAQMRREALADERRVDAGGHAVADTVEQHEHEDVAAVGPEGQAQAEDRRADGADEEELLAADLVGDLAAAGRADDHGDVTGCGDPAAGLHADLRLHIVGQPGDEAVVAVEVQDHGDRPDDEGLAHTRVRPDLGIGVDLFALSLIALVAVGLGSGERGGVLHAEDHDDDEESVMQSSGSYYGIQSVDIEKVNEIYNS